MTDTPPPREPQDAARTAETMLRAMMEASGKAAQAFAPTGELGEMVLGMARENAARFAEAMGAIATAKTPLEAARVYSEYLMSSTQRVSRQFLDVTETASRHATMGDGTAR